ncbi:hypothetical protein KCP77_15120 [Salmonella enterica subsp. enterica]|nr:hypothetical protein KCP77_15120 [Salmonella enterica subsp. enterica]
MCPRMLSRIKARCKQRAEELMDMVALDARKFLHQASKARCPGTAAYWRDPRSGRRSAGTADG